MTHTVYFPLHKTADMAASGASLLRYDGAMHCAFKFLERYPDQVVEARFQLQLANDFESQLTVRQAFNLF